MKTLALFVPLALLLACASEPAAVADEPKTVVIGKITWYTSYDQAMKIARKTNKPLFLHFGENPG